MSISLALANATSGLGAVSRQAGIASQNIANALTPGYNRREASLAERTLAGEGAGVRVAGINRAEVPALTAERRDAQSEAAELGVRAAAAEKISRMLGGPEDSGSLFRRFAAFDQSLRFLANSPDSAPAQQAVVSDALNLLQRINSIANAYQDMRTTADGEIASSVAKINSGLTELGRLNDQIAGATVAGRDASSLLDQRDRLLDSISKEIPVKPLVREHGRIDLMTSEGVMLFSGTAREIQFTRTPVITAGMSLIGGSLSGLSVDGVDITPGASARAPATGALAGLFAVRDNLAPQAAAEIDALAEDLIFRTQASGLDPTLGAGAAGLFTDNGAALTPPAAVGTASRISLNDAVDPTQGGALWRLRDGLGASTPGAVGSDKLLRDLIAAFDAPQTTTLGSGRAYSVLENASELSASAAGRLSSVEAALQSSMGFAQQLHDAELAETGVDTDAELQNLLLIEQAYAANARLIQTVGEMIDRLMEI
ncbi:MAG: flagellar hook-associated protein FlgK [Alphaproteobacteria bacterium RIFCSPHIGHO2_12_FULL_63_12]|nr:MAG: flagellar hook-associated protein FlgK [Alphaproteobacteria bacterium RIFCSPHIGHO2_12_FULL_63_12]